MSRNYGVPGNCTNTQSTTNAIVNIVSSATCQPGIFEIDSGCDATPANQAVKYQITRFTAAGTLQGSITPNALDPGAGTAVASVTAACQSTSVLPTYSGTILQWAQNQNTAFRWVASGIGRMLKIPSTANAGAGMMPAVVTSAFNAVFHIMFEE
jgi:hypothetical protein